MSTEAVRPAGRKGAPGPRPRFTWQGRYAPPRVEAGYQERNWDRFSSRVRALCFITSPVYLFACLVDLLNMGPGTGFTVMFTARLTASLTGAAAGMLTLRDRPTPLVEALLAAYMFLILVAESIEPHFWVGDMGSAGSLTLLILLCFYIFVPIRLSWQLAACLTGSVVFMASLAASPAVPGEHTVAVGLFALLINLFGFFHVRMLNRLMRERDRWERLRTGLIGSLRREIAERRMAQEKLSRLATTDELTGVPNRRSFMASAQHEFNRSFRREEPMSVLVADLDHFKRVNDTLGHAAGDEVLRQMAGRMKSVLREIDIFARIGGEEFAAVLPGADEEEARAVAERLHSLARVPLTVRGREIVQSVSVGVAQLRAGDVDLDDVLLRADNALYRAKGRGRDQVCVADETPELRN